MWLRRYYDFEEYNRPELPRDLTSLSYDLRRRYNKSVVRLRRHAVTINRAGIYRRERTSSLGVSSPFSFLIIFEDIRRRTVLM